MPFFVSKCFSLFNRMSCVRPHSGCLLNRNMTGPVPFRGFGIFDKDEICRPFSYFLFSQFSNTVIDSHNLVTSFVIRLFSLSLFLSRGIFQRLSVPKFSLSVSAILFRFGSATNQLACATVSKQTNYCRFFLICDFLNTYSVFLFLKLELTILCTINEKCN